MGRLKRYWMLLRIFLAGGTHELNTSKENTISNPLVNMCICNPGTLGQSRT